MSDLFGNTSGLRLPGLEGIGALIESQNFDFSDKSIQTLDAMAESQIQSPGNCTVPGVCLECSNCGWPHHGLGHIMGPDGSLDECMFRSDRQC